MKNLILAILGIVTALFLTSHPAFAEGSGSNALSGDSPSDAMGVPQGASLSSKYSAVPCSACASQILDGRLGDNTVSRPGASATSSSGTKSNDGTR
jgi:hypothetical protein